MRGGEGVENDAVERRLREEKELVSVGSKIYQIMN